MSRLHIAVLLVFAGRCLVVALVAAFPVPFDEHAHFSYVWHVVERADPAPRLDDLYLLDLPGLAGWTGERNYLNHPSPYYALMGLLAWPLPPATAVVALRLANALLAAAAVAAALWIGRRAAWPLEGQLVYAVLLIAVPTLPVLGGIVTNDNMALLGGALLCAGVFDLLRGDRRGGGATAPGTTWAVVATGFALAALAKLTAALLCGAFLACALVLVRARDGGWTFLRPAAAVAALMVCAAALLPYAALALAYGSPAPLTEGQADVIAGRLAETPAWAGDARLTPWAYLGHFAWSLLVYWPPSPPTTRIELALLAAPAACLIAAALGVLRAAAAGRRALDDPTAAFILCGAAAVTLVLVAHLGFTYQRHLETGWLRGIYPRYYFPLLPVFPAACAFAVTRRGASPAGARRAGIGLAAAGLVALAVAYDAAPAVIDAVGPPGPPGPPAPGGGA